MHTARPYPIFLVLAVATAGCGASDTAVIPATTPAASSSTTMNQSADVRRVIVNGVELDTTALAELDGAARTRVPAGDYWYDSRSGACGARGGPTAAFLPPKLKLAALRADASGGGSGNVTSVFVNGREIHVADYQALSRLGEILPGRYWLEANGNWGVEGYESPLGNLLQAASTAGPGGPGYNRSTAGGHLMSDGQSAGWFDPKSGASVLVGG